MTYTNVVFNAYIMCVSIDEKEENVFNELRSLLVVFSWSSSCSSSSSSLFCFRVAPRAVPLTAFLVLLLKHVFIDLWDMYTVPFVDVIVNLGVFVWIFFGLFISVKQHKLVWYQTVFIRIERYAVRAPKGRKIVKVSPKTITIMYSTLYSIVGWCITPRFHFHHHHQAWHFYFHLRFNFPLMNPFPFWCVCRRVPYVWKDQIRSVTRYDSSEIPNSLSNAPNDTIRCVVRHSARWRITEILWARGHGRTNGWMDENRWERWSLYTRKYFWGFFTSSSAVASRAVPLFHFGEASALCVWYQFDVGK